MYIYIILQYIHPFFADEVEAVGMTLGLELSQSINRSRPGVWERLESAELSLSAEKKRIRPRIRPNLCLDPPHNVKHTLNNEKP